MNTTDKQNDKYAAICAEAAKVGYDLAAGTRDTVNAQAQFSKIAEQASVSAAALLERLTANAPVIAAMITTGRVKQADLAREVAGTSEKTAVNTATQAIGRIVKTGKLMVAFPRKDALAMNQFANRATADEMKQALAGEIDPATSKPKAAKPKAGAKDKAGEKTRTYREDVIALSQAAAKVGKRGGELMELGTLDPKDQVLLIHSLEAALKLHRGLLDLASKNFKAAAAK